MQPDGVLSNGNKELTKELTDIRMWNDGTKDQYLDLLDYWTQKVEKIKNRKLMRHGVNECDCVTQVSKLNFSISLIITHSFVLKSIKLYFNFRGILTN